MGSLSPIHLIIVLVIALLVIGPGKLPEVGAALGNSIREFRKASSDTREQFNAATRVETSPPADTAPDPAQAVPVATSRGAGV